VLTRMPQFVIRWGKLLGQLPNPPRKMAVSRKQTLGLFHLGQTFSQKKWLDGNLESLPTFAL
jgi:hypothetical protein